MTAKEALQVVEKVREIVQLSGKEADILRNAVFALNNFIVENEEYHKEQKAKVIPVNNSGAKD